MLGGTGVGRSRTATRAAAARGVGAPRQTAVNTSLFFGLLAAFLFGLGIALDYLL